MIRLVRVELTRLRWRRAVLLLLALGVVATAVIFVGVVVNTRSQTIDDIAADNGPQVLQEVERCITHPRQYSVRKDDPDLQTACENRIAGYYGASVLDLVEQRESGSGPALVALLADHPAAGRHDVRRARLEHRLDEQPAALRATSAPGLGRQGHRGRPGRGDRDAGAPGRLLDRALGGRVGARPADPGARRRGGVQASGARHERSSSAPRCSATRSRCCCAPPSARSACCSRRRSWRHRGRVDRLRRRRAVHAVEQLRRLRRGRLHLLRRGRPAPASTAPRPRTRSVGRTARVYFLVALVVVAAASLLSFRSRDVP